MITKDEIRRIAGETGLRPDVVEKDYVLGWLLAAVNANAILGPSWVFKGGTCLKKCYFETYRFSEDLDFTLQDESQLDEAFLLEKFTSISEWMYETCGMEIPVDRIKFDIYIKDNGRPSCQGSIYYASHFVPGKKRIPRVKLDLTADEVLVLPPAQVPVMHPYRDEPESGIFINAYDYPEVFGEKVRALGERGRPRDLYDVINLWRNDRIPSTSVLLDVLRQKCEFKSIALPRLEDMARYKATLEISWEDMLAHQLPVLPSLDSFWSALTDFFAWLYQETAPAVEQLAPISRSGLVYRPAYGQLGLRTTSGQSLEIIRFAAGNRLCVNLDYTDMKGERKSRVIEPYSLRETKDGNILLYAVRADDGGNRSYRIEQINSASVTQREFVPRHQVELSPESPVSVPPTRIGGQLRGTSSGRSSGFRATRRASGGLSSGPIYVYRCTLCGKTFRRKKKNSRLRPHKTPNRWPCTGRTAHLQDTIF